MGRVVRATPEQMRSHRGGRAEAGRLRCPKVREAPQASDPGAGADPVPANAGGMRRVYKFRHPIAKTRVNILSVRCGLAMYGDFPARAERRSSLSSGTVELASGVIRQRPSASPGDKSTTHECAPQCAIPMSRSGASAWRACAAVRRSMTRPQLVPSRARPPHGRRWPRPAPGLPTTLLPYNFHSKAVTTGSCFLAGRRFADAAPAQPEDRTFVPTRRPPRVRVRFPPWHVGRGSMASASRREAQRLLADLGRGEGPVC